VVAEVLKKLSTRKLNVAVYGVGTVQEELGLRGATTSCFDINPDVGFAIDVGFTTALPDMPKTHLGDIRMGQGPELNRSADNNEALGRMLQTVAAKHKIPYQESPGHRASGGTDTAVMQLTGSGVATALISIPNRYMHTQVEVCDLRDVDNAVKLLSKTIESFSGTESFIPGLD
jgi:endoglucanase